ncbi:UbiA-like protein EboC [Flavobacteriaceae bacterium F89]|uniref:UbiA-like protein EboC n=1 Tax=Cerina litoralis TaxID=2874477 RepID=A0AAE3EVJ3_9FLAO|nr:UbiA-like protein EboC [Cerina litoralis]MCG2461855.1 UbiA-like protein EboC [Cerina litoralis]
MNFKAYAQLARPANLPTAAADILAGAAIAGTFILNDQGKMGELQIDSLLLLVASSLFLYAAGVILNDVFDFKLDQIERPERPIPSGMVSLRSAAIYGAILLLLGILLAFLVNSLSGIVALLLAVSILFYDAIAKQHSIFGPLNMGVCRGLNLLLGISILGTLPYWWFAFVPIVYIASITLISRGEVHGNNKKHIIFAAVLYAVVILLVLGLLYLGDRNLGRVLPFLAIFAIAVFLPLFKAYRENSPENIKKAVVAGVLSVILLDSAIAVGFSHWWIGVLMILLLPLSLGLSRLFAVT